MPKEILSQIQIDALRILEKGKIIIHQKIVMGTDFFTWKLNDVLSKTTVLALKRMMLIEKISHEKEDTCNKFYAISEKGKNAIIADQAPKIEIINHKKAMLNTNIEDSGKHAYDLEAVNKWLEIIHPETKTFSVGIFKWELTKDGKALKSSKVLVRVIGHPTKAQYVFETADKVVSRLNDGTWHGSKSVKV